jgi:hypothetical protein
MKRILIVCTAVALSFFGAASISSAQVFIRAPFVRVGVGDGVYVRAPFVNLYVPDGPYYGPVYGPRIVTLPPPVVVVPQPAPAPPVIQPQAPPAPVPPAQVPTLDAFAKTFQPKGGTHEVTILNPLTNQPTSVRFTLPEGTPRRVIVDRNSIEWVYNLRTRVMVEFDRGGATVIAR